MAGGRVAGCCAPMRPRWAGLESGIRKHNPAASSDQAMFGTVSGQREVVRWLSGSEAVEGGEKGGRRCRGRRRTHR